MYVYVCIPGIPFQTLITRARSKMRLFFYAYFYFALVPTKILIPVLSFLRMNDLRSISEMAFSADGKRILPMKGRLRCMLHASKTKLVEAIRQVNMTYMLLVSLWRTNLLKRSILSRFHWEAFMWNPYTQQPKLNLWTTLEEK